ncbi:hypothetical protein HFP57_02140 [Parasphingopyxis algicola]|uniref:PilZ domain-containing protein n=1 Tax=Parasphingopyxis algicola TaxID=2026624 RepID=UPI0015A39E22|nr:PilZ domain-containing protein [Parasphingopyxis algicola]QLC23948.1 hypothetical protein HFP57_02140 [Parasphingopyxis algicola]
MTQERAGDNEPRDPRQEVEIRMGFRKPGYPKTKGDLLNISRTGFQLDSAAVLGESDRLFLYLPGLQPLSATVVWRNDFRIGCKFDTPISDYVYDNLISRLTGD